MSDDVRQAAERVLDDLKNDCPREWIDLDAARLLAEFALAARPPDDAEAVTEEWLRAVGIDSDTPHKVGGTMIRILRRDSGDVRLNLSDGYYCVGAGLAGPVTRGVVRRLASDLGVQLKEP